MPPVSERQRRATDPEKAYLAGIVDGEGCIGAAHYKRKSGSAHQKTGKRHTMFTVFVAMGDREPVDLICALYGGHVRERADKRGAPRRMMYCWQGYSSIGARFLMDMLPYLRVKTRQAELYIAAMATFTGGPRKGQQGSVSPTQEELARREAYADAIQAANQRKAA